MENARRAIVPTHQDLSTKSKPSTKKYSFNSKSKSDTERRKSVSLEPENTRSFSDREIKIGRKINDHKRPDSHHSEVSMSSSLQLEKNTPLLGTSKSKLESSRPDENVRNLSDSEIKPRKLQQQKPRQISEVSKQKLESETRKYPSVSDEKRILSDTEVKLRKKVDETRNRRVIDSKSKSDTEKRKSFEPDPRSFSDRDVRTRKISDRSNRQSGDFDKTKTLDKYRDSDKKKVLSASKNYDVSKRMDELTAITKETLARVEKLTNKNDRRCSLPKVDRNEENSNLIIDLTVDDDNDDKPSSILKKKSLDEVVSPPTSVHVQLPVSILKRKSSQDELGTTSFSTPVTFSPNVMDNTSSRKKQGILKKRCSLDESHVNRRRSYSPDVALIEGSSDCRPILKTQRRSSLEEIVRTRSPDLHLQGILKRKHSRGEEDFKDRSLGSPEPQSILKRKSGTSSTGSSGSSPHVSIATAVILAAAGGAEIILDTETVKPILKKKSFSEENPCLDSLNQDAPKPILKKKSSTETDDQEDRPMKPILKSSKKSSEENYSSRDSNEDSPRIHSVLRNRSSHNSCESGSECETVRPILKQSSSRENSPRLKLSFSSESHSGRSSPRRKPVKRSNTIGDSELSVLCAKRGSDDYNDEDDSPEEEHKKPSVFSMIMNFEKGNVGTSTGAIPKRSNLKGGRSKGRYSTQPITLDEFEATAR